MSPRPNESLRRLVVLHLMASGERGGGLDHLAGLLAELQRHGVVCRAAIGAQGPGAARLRGLGIEVDTLELMASRLDPRGPGRVSRLVAKHRPDVVHAHGTRAAFFAVLGRFGRRPFGPPHVYTAHGLAYRQAAGRPARAALLGAEALVCRNVERVITVSRRDLADLERRHLLRPGSGRHVPNAVDTARFVPGGGAAARERAGIPAEAWVVGTVSRLVPQKAVSDLVEAVTRLGETLAGRPIHLVVIGEGPQRLALEALAAPLGDRAHFLGGRDDVAQLLGAFDVFALASRWEGEPVALLEALACGLPCLATDTAGSREVLEGNSAGRLVPVASPTALAMGLRELLADPAAREAMAAAARPSVAQRSFEGVAAAVREVYGELVGRGAL